MVDLEDVARTYLRGRSEVHALTGVSLHVAQGEFLSIMGPSGSGKSTLLNLLGALDLPTRGDIRIGGVSLRNLDDDGLTLFRRERVGFVFQFFNLLPTMSALENVCLPGMLAGRPLAELKSRAEGLLGEVGMGKRAHHFPDELSGGEMQRVAIARALLLKPPLLLADEPTGNLDSSSGESVLLLLRQLVDEHRQTLIMVTHDSGAAAYGHRLVTLRDGAVVEDRLIQDKDSRGLASGRVGGAT